MEDVREARADGSRLPLLAILMACRLCVYIRSVMVYAVNLEMRVELELG